MNYSLPKVSVIIPCYNQGQYLDEAVESVLAQTYQNFEIIIVNDGSTEPYTNQILKDYNKPKTVVIKTENYGLASARNTGIKVAKGEYILPLDADDKIENTYIEKAIRVLDTNENIGIVYCDAQHFGERHEQWSPEYRFPDILLRNMIFCSGFFRKTDWEKTNGYDNKMIYGWEDFDFWLSLIELGREVFRIPEVLFYYRKYSNSMLESMTQEHKIYSYTRLFENHPQLYIENIKTIFAEIVNLKVAIEQCKHSRDEYRKNCEQLISEKNELSKKCEQIELELKEILNSRTWRVIQNIKNNPLGQAIGHEFLNFFQKNPVAIQPQILSNTINTLLTEPEKEHFIQSFQEKGKDVLAVYVPNWLGIKSATINHFKDCYPLAEHLTKEQAEYYGDLFVKAGVKHFISAGAAPGHLEVIKVIHKLNPSIRCDITWHASYIQHCEDYGWSMMNHAITLAKQGVIYKFGLAKKGMEKSFQAMGLKAEFLPNLVQTIPDKASTVNSVNTELGIWLSWIGYRKLPYAMIAASQLVKNSALNMSGVGYRAKEWAEMLGVKVKFFSDGSIAKEELYQRIKNTHLSLYLTSSECAPMLPIESLSLGVPCLISPVSHWFEDDEYLHSRLVVPYPERPEIIAKYIEQAVEERKQIIDRYKVYATRYNEWANQQLNLFLGD